MRTNIFFSVPHCAGRLWTPATQHNEQWKEIVELQKNYFSRPFVYQRGPLQILRGFILKKEMATGEMKRNTVLKTGILH